FVDPGELGGSGLEQVERRQLEVVAHLNRRGVGRALDGALGLGIDDLRAGGALSARLGPLGFRLGRLRLAGVAVARARGAPTRASTLRRFRLGFGLRLVAFVVCFLLAVVGGILGVWLGGVLAELTRRGGGVVGFRLFLLTAPAERVRNGERERPRLVDGNPLARA